MPTDAPRLAVIVGNTRQFARRAKPLQPSRTTEHSRRCLQMSYRPRYWRWLCCLLEANRCQSQPLRIRNLPSSLWLHDCRDFIKVSRMERHRQKAVAFLKRRGAVELTQPVRRNPPAFHFHSQQAATMRIDDSTLTGHLHHARVELVARDVLRGVGRVESDAVSRAELFL